VFLFSGPPGSPPPVAEKEGKTGPSLSPGNPESLLLQARAGDQKAREKLIADYTPFVLRVAARAAGRYLQAGVDDEFSVGLSAFNEAIDSFNPEGGMGFLRFSEMVIRRRLIDYYRKEGNRPELPLTSFDESDEEGHWLNVADTEAGWRSYVAERQRQELQEEIKLFSDALREYGIRLADLVEASPRHADARERSREVARLVARTPAWADYLRRKKELPLKDIEQAVALSRKTLERQRKYIIALAIIFMEDLPHLREYLRT